jgi:hypothetical protein
MGLGVFPKSWGARVMNERLSAPFCGLRSWIPAFAGMTGVSAAGCCRGLGRPQISLIFPQDLGDQRGLKHGQNTIGTG